jgi:hypothetical protein
VMLRTLEPRPSAVVYRQGDLFIHPAADLRWRKIYRAVDSDSSGLG